MKKIILMLGLCGCLLMCGLRIEGLFTQNIEAAENKDEIDIELEESTQDITVVYYDGGYAKYLSIYDVDNKGEGGFRAWSGYNFKNICTYVDNLKYNASFNFPLGADYKEYLAEYIELFSENSFADKESIEEFLDDLLRRDIITLYVCNDTSIPRDTTEGIGLYAYCYEE